MRGRWPSHLSFLLILILIAGSCEETPDISHPADPIPVIYGIFDKKDTVHFLKVGKTFQANSDPLSSASVFDSLYFDEPEVTVYYNGLNDSLKPTIVNTIPKDEGIFSFPNQLIYSFRNQDGRRFRGTIAVSVRYPGIQEAYGEVKLLDSTKINTPKKVQQYIYLVPESPILVQWDIPPWPVPYIAQWYEIDFGFEFIEEIPGALRSRIVHIQNSNFNLTETPKYYELNITYEEFIRDLLIQLPVDPAVIRRYFGYHYIMINSADQNIVNYTKFLDGSTDFNNHEFSNIQNGIGLIASRTSGLVDSLQFDFKTRQQLINENRLKKYKFVIHQPPLSSQ